MNVAEPQAWAQETAAPAYPACATAADEAALQAARGAFEAGKAAFNEADYGRAIIYWEDAFRRDCSASLLLKNLGRAYEANGQFEHAVVALTTFLEREPNSQDRAELEAQIAQLKNRTQAAAPAPAPARAPTPSVQPAPAKASPQPAPVATSSESEDYYPADDASETSNAPSAAGPIVLASVGAAVAVTGGVLWWLAHEDETKAENECPSRMSCPVGVEARGNEAIDRQLRWGLLAGGGLVLLSGGIAWYLLQPSETTALTPSLGPDFAGVELSGHF